MKTLRELLAEKAGGPTAPAPLPSAMLQVEMPAVATAPDRQLGTREAGAKDAVLPMAWPHDPAVCAGNRLSVMLDRESQGWLGILLPDGRFLYLLGPLESINIPF